MYLCHHMLSFRTFEKSQCQVNAITTVFAIQIPGSDAGENPINFQTRIDKRNIGKNIWWRSDAKKLT